MKWQRLYPLLLGLAALSVAFAVIVGHEADYLVHVEQQNLFLATPLFFQQCMAVAGGFLSYICTWLTQFLYLPSQGALVVCGCCGVLMLLVGLTFRLPARWAPVLLLPLALGLLMQFTLGYWTYELKLKGFFFAGVVGFSVALLPAWAYRYLRNWWCRLALLLLTAVVLYPLAGFYGLLAVAVMALMEWRMTPASLGRRMLTTAVALLVGIVLPLVCYRYLYNQTHIDDIWRQGLPLFAQGENEHPVYLAPYGLMCVLFLLLAVSQRWSAPCTSCDGPKGSRSKRWAVAILHVVAVVAVGYGCWHYWYKDENFHRELQMNECIERLDWQGVVDQVAQAERPTRLMIMYKYLALFKMGRAGNEMYNLPDNDQLPNFCGSIPMVQQGGMAAYLHYGIQNFCYRWCVEDGVEFNWRVKHLKYMVRCALLGHEWQAARKYIDLLRHTRYHDTWAEHYATLIGHPERIAEDPELGPITHVMGTHDALASDQSMLENFMLSQLAGLVTDDPVGADLALMAAVQLKSIPAFWRAFFQYAQLHQGEPMPRHYQEAALMYGNLEHTVDISRMPFDQAVVDNYQAFMQFAQQCQGMNNEQMKHAFRPRFGNTFFYNYFLLRDLKTY